MEALSDLLLISETDMQGWSVTNTKPGELYPITTKLRILEIKKILSLQYWYVSHSDPDESLWNTINKKDYLEWLSPNETERVRTSLGLSKNVSNPCNAGLPSPIALPDTLALVTSPYACDHAQCI